MMRLATTARSRRTATSLPPAVSYHAEPLRMLFLGSIDEDVVIAKWFRIGNNTKSDFVFWPILYHIWKLHVKCDSEQLFFVDMSI